MSSKDSGSPSASDIITYVGVPLAVLGVLPIAYNALVTAVHWFEIKRELKLSNITAKMRFDGLSRIIEVQFPAYLIRPPATDSDDSRIENMWKPIARSGKIEGGTWRLLEWKVRNIGTEPQRIQPGDRLRQPPAKIYFWDLLAYLYRLGALPNVEGWSELYSKRLWARKGCVLMTIGSQKALLVAPLEHLSDDQLSLELGGKPDWPSIMQEGQRAASPLGTITLSLASLNKAYDPDATPFLDQPAPSLRGSSAAFGGDQQATVPAREETNSEPADRDKRIICHVSENGITDAYAWQVAEPSLPESRRSLDIGHLTISNRQPSQGIWFASCITASHVSTSSPILSYIIPANILDTGGTKIIPRGVLELLGVIPHSEYATWTAPNSPSGQSNSSKRVDSPRFVKRPSMMETSSSMLEELREEIRREDEDRTVQVEGALKTIVLENSRVASHSLDWLKSQGFLVGTITEVDAVRDILSRMIIDQDFAIYLCEMLDRWKAWTAKGGMGVEDLDFVLNARYLFAQASLVIYSLGDVVNGPARVLLDIQGCADKWETVMLS